MKQSAYGRPISIDDGKVELLKQIEALDEASIQELVFKYPECLPISDIDESFNPVIPICTELSTPVGPLDIFMVTPTGELIIIETKLWRNPEARRVVIAQILDYAKELSKWTYEDLQRETNRRLKSTGNTLYKMASEGDSNLLLEEKDFIDTISRNLFRGRFLLLIVGDGIREGASGIAEFLEAAGHLNFTFGMVELSIYQKNNLETIILPRTVVKTVELQKYVVEIPHGFSLSASTEKTKVNTNIPSYSPDWEKEKMFYTKFWSELVAELVFDDPGQPLPNPATGQNLYVYPGKSRRAWVSAYFMKSKNRVGVYFRCQKDLEGREIYSFLDEDKEKIHLEAGHDSVWAWDVGDGVGYRMNCDDVFDDNKREEIKEFFKDKINQLINIFRPRMRGF